LVQQLEQGPDDPWRFGWKEQRPLAVSPDGTILAAAGVNNSVCLWDLTTGRELNKRSGHAGQILSLAFSPDGKTLVSGSEDTTALVWDVPARH